ncbi:prepilin-type N-terminal cleavage/methylation domain-containing protein [Marinobacter sp. TBZ242]|uniref:Prepilin-type N-terminal cleavage/methylation domain-containing protein n=1 Tax=Marinobacter azerbaijanicus TaxID=3050455 RepID=A0ABT7IIR6_9GAMM|nr:prepilin-type N-terminal cleavage/methylation domain-containing protein [Marinobacter sp. TBZ242]MDL0434071.1 prepilin-type N-terminal cleavage/methylation domain-containing protein [Marinobacter sp. TBZ242]
MSPWPSIENGRRGRLRQSGFTLIELMVALVIGLVIILGAGQLFLVGLQNFRQTEFLGNKQAALTFASEMLIRDIRRANVDASGTPKISFSDTELRIEIINNGDTNACSDGNKVVRVYRLSNTVVSASEGWSLDMGQNCNDAPSGSDFEPLVAGFAKDGFVSSETDEGSGIWVIRFTLLSNRDGDTDNIEFYATNRTAAVANIN